MAVSESLRNELESKRAAHGLYDATVQAIGDQSETRMWPFRCGPPIWADLSFQLPIASVPVLEVRNALPGSGHRLF